MSRFLRLLRKDLEASRWPLGILSGAIVGLLTFAWFRMPPAGHVDWEAAAFVMAIPFVFLPFWLLWQSFQSLRSEWREDTVYTLLVLPVPGWQILISKMLEICIEYTVLLLVSLGGGLILFHGHLEALLLILPRPSWLLWNGFILYLVSLAVLAAFVSVIQLSFVVSKMVGRLQGLVALWVLILANWLVAKSGIILEPVFRWLPPLPLHRIFDLQELGREIVLEWNIAPEVGTWLGIIALFFLTSYLLENYLEIN